MVHLRRFLRRRSPGCSHWAVMSGVAFFFCGQLALALVLSWWPLRIDPEYDFRLESLRACMAERPARQPVLFLGSSRVTCTFRPGLLAVNHGNSDVPVVFNFGLCRSGPVMELLCLRRLLADGVHPESIFVEVWPKLVRADGPIQIALIDPERLRWSDTRLLRRFTPDAQYGSWQWLVRRFTYWRMYRKQLLSPRTLSQVLANKQHEIEWQGLDHWGWLAIPGFKTYDERPRPALGQEFVKGEIAVGDGFSPSADSLRAYGELFDLCRREKITVSLVALPDGFLHDYSPDGRRLMDLFLRRLSQENNLALVDARAWASTGDFVDGVHMTHNGAAAFTKRFGRDVLDPFLNGEPLIRRWPPGHLDAFAPSGLAPTGPLSLIEGR
jgi:hypothetical protein